PDRLADGVHDGGAHGLHRLTSACPSTAGAAAPARGAAPFASEPPRHHTAALPLCVPPCGRHPSPAPPRPARRVPRQARNVLRRSPPRDDVVRVHRSAGDVDGGCGPGGGAGCGRGDLKAGRTAAPVTAPPLPPPEAGPTPPGARAVLDITGRRRLNADRGGVTSAAPGAGTRRRRRR